jgi:hypothetical protein
VVQIALGALTVLAGNDAPTVAAHLLAEVTMLGGATVTAVCALVPARATAGPRPGPVVWLGGHRHSRRDVRLRLPGGQRRRTGVRELPAMPAEQPAALVWPHLVHRGIAVLAGIALLTFSMRPGAALPYAEPVRWPPPLASRAP